VTTTNTNNPIPHFVTPATPTPLLVVVSLEASPSPSGSTGVARYVVKAFPKSPHRQEQSNHPNNSYSSVPPHLLDRPSDGSFWAAQSAPQISVQPTQRRHNNCAFTCRTTQKDCLGKASLPADRSLWTMGKKQREWCRLRTLLGLSSVVTRDEEKKKGGRQSAPEDTSKSHVERYENQSKSCMICLTLAGSSSLSLATRSSSELNLILSKTRCF